MRKLATLAALTLAVAVGHAIPTTGAGAVPPMPPRAGCAIASTHLTLAFDGRRYLFDTVALCPNGGATLAGHRAILDQR